MKQLLILPLLLCGCAHFTTDQDDNTLDSTGKATHVVHTHASATTLFDANSQLAQFKASQTDKTQSASVGSLNQNSSGTNVVAALQAVAALAGAIAK